MSTTPRGGTTSTTRSTSRASRSENLQAYCESDGTTHNDPGDPQIVFTNAAASGGYTITYGATVPTDDLSGVSIGIYVAMTPQPTPTPTIGPSHTPTPQPTATVTITSTPTLRSTPTAAGTTTCCQCPHPFAGCFGGIETCPEACTLYINAACNAETGQCKVFTPTPTQVVENVIYVSASLGSASYPGTAVNPLDTIQAGIDAATAKSGSAAVVIDGGTYNESLTVNGPLANSVTIAGGFNSGKGWIKDGSTTTVSGGPTAVSLESVSNLSIMDLTIEAGQVTPTPGQDSAASSIGIWLKDAVDVTINGCTVTSSFGASGIGGVNGTDGPPGVKGDNGAPGCEYGCIGDGDCVRPGFSVGGAAVVCSAGAQSGTGGQAGEAGSCDSNSIGGSDGGAATPDGGSGGKGGQGDLGCSIPLEPYVISGAVSYGP